MRLYAALPLAVTACAAAPPRSAAPPVAAAPVAADDTGAAGARDPRLRRLLHDHWEWTMVHHPLFASEVGDHRFDDQIDDESPAARAAASAARKRWLATARAIDPKKLDDDDRVHLAIFTLMIASEVDAEICRFADWAVSAFAANPINQWNELPEQHRVVTVKDGQNLLSRYRQIAHSIDLEIGDLAHGAKAGRIANAESIRRVIAIAEKQLAQPIDEWPLLAPIKAAHTNWSLDEERAFKDGLVNAVKNDIRPAFARYLRFISTELLPHARSDEQAGIGALPDGAACYRALIKAHTGLPLGAPELHQLGIDEMDKIHHEMRPLAEELFGSGIALKDAFARLRSEPRFYFATAAEVMQKATESLAAAKAKLPSFFGLLPRVDCVIKRVPDYEAPFSTIAYYKEAHADGSKPGEYRVNVFQPETRPRHEAAVLAFHESIPGHHLQIAIAQERPALPAFRRHFGVTAFVEGWALYCERLAAEMGLYADDADRMGMLDYDAWRAARLVVDTGIHAFGWSRARAVAYMLENTALPENNIRNEVDRYINDPGQALAYKVGQLEIWRLRRQAEHTLGTRFDVRRFHDAVLSGGAVPLIVMADQVQSWIKREQ
jgi:uncharacterized protein (DUF885 family)